MFKKIFGIQNIKLKLYRLLFKKRKKPINSKKINKNLTFFKNVQLYNRIS